METGTSTQEPMAEQERTPERSSDNDRHLERVPDAELCRTPPVIEPRHSPVNRDLERSSLVKSHSPSPARDLADDTAKNSSLDIAQFANSINAIEESATVNAKIDTNLSDVESFDGKIVYNPDGSAYIIEGDTESEDSLLDLPKQEGSIVESRDKIVAPHSVDYPQIANAFYVTKNSFLGAYYIPDKKLSDAPTMHSYRVYDLRSGQKNELSSQKLKLENVTVPTKPILMCFICKLSFGYAKSFVAHSIGEHSMTLLEEENEVLKDNNVSAIIQALGKEKEPRLSFLVPNCNTVQPSGSKSEESNSPDPVDQEYIRNNNNIDLKKGNEVLGQRFSPKTEVKYSVPTSSPLFTFGHNDQMSYLGHCDDHPQGKIQGVECPKCDLILSSTRSLGGHMTMMHSRNSCKTLKCPKCNWHYKYQETLEIHMKEKHPETDQHCIYCLAHQPHPRLARGESYTCGYKPYRCEVCNYSTTTKGNLSIHMQSDKHINNMQDLQNTSEMKVSQAPMQQAPPTTSQQQHAVSVSPEIDKTKAKAKPTWRCDVCNYETTVARNLRIHMTSEKHTHNMLVLQQNVKHMARDMHMHMPLALYGQQDLMSLQQLANYDQFMPETPVDLTTETKEDCGIYHCCICNIYSTDRIELIHQHMQMDRTKALPDDNVSVINGNYICQLCQYKTNLKANFQLHCKTDKHLQRLQLINHIKEGGSTNEWRVQYMNLSNPIQIRCNTCDYYTNSIHKLQLHETNSRHDFHVRIFMYLAAREVAVPAEKRYYYCSMCEYPAKTRLRLMQHIGSVRHLQSESLHQLKQQEQGQIPELDVTRCFLVKEMNEEHDINFNEEFTEDEPRTVHDKPDSPEASCSPKDHQQPPGAEEPAPEPSTSDQPVCPYCTFEASTQSELQNHISHQHTSSELLCPLCQDAYKTRDRLEKHLGTSHNVNVEAMQRLMMVVDQQLGRILSPNDDVMSEDSYDVTSDISDNDVIKMTDEAMDTDEDQFRCTTCNRIFANIDALYAHQNELGHLELKQTPRGPGYLCWKKGCNQYFKTAQALQVHFREIHARKQQLAVSDRHVYKYRCNQCSLAFKTAEKLQMHSQYHAMRAATKCIVCERSFRTIATMKKHVESTHIMSMKPEQLVQYQAVLASMPAALLVNGENNNNNNNNDEEIALDRNHNESPIAELETPRIEDMETASAQNSEDDQDMEEMNRKALEQDSYNDSDCKFKCHRCKVAFTKQNYLTSHNKTNFHRKGDRNSTYSPVDKFNDPNRPHKCDVCRESFTQKNILLVHYNSVSHLHKLKQQSNSAIVTSSPMTSSSQDSTSTSQDSKPYRCNICNVAYTQVSTLEIHMRSVLHQSRASKLQESNDKRSQEERPPSSGPEAGALSAKRPASLPNIENRDLPQMLPPLTIPPNNLLLSHKSPSLSPMSDNQICQKCGSMFPNQELLIKHQQMYCYFGLSPNSTQALAQKRARQHRSHVQKNLLENFGFECVMQFNEYSQRRKEAESPSEESKPVAPKPKPEEVGMPDIKKSQCGNCKKEFSSIWVLKAHQEEVHGECVPLEVVEKFGEEYKVEYEKKEPVSEPGPMTPPPKQERSDTPMSDTSSVKTESQPTVSANEMAMNQFAMMPMMQMGMPMGLQMMGMQGVQAMQGMQPPMMPLMLPTMGENQFMLPPFMDSGLLGLQKLQQQQQQAAQAAQQAQLNQQKRARTRINDEQLKILRKHFDINNSPAEEQIITMSEQSGLPLKVIKHWFRNTLFKERQRNKDSPYNFNNPPSTTLNLEEYEKTGRICSEPSSGAPSPAETPKSEYCPTTSQTTPLAAPPPPPLKTTPKAIKEETATKFIKQEPKEVDTGLTHYDSKSPLRSTISPQRMSTPLFSSAASSSMMELYLNSQPILSTPMSTSPTSCTDTFGMSAMSRRANRTRFTDYQIKVLQEYFEQNAYPKDDDLEHLSKMLNLSPRVIVVWFQNARQKARKVYENQPAGEENDDGRFVRTPGLNYQCKKCMTVFQRYYELIKHQKKHCFKDEDITMHHVFGKDRLSHSSNHSDSRSESNASEDDTPRQKRTPDKNDSRDSRDEEDHKASFRCEKCDLTFTKFSQWQEHQSIHMMNPTLFQSFAPDSAFGMLQNLAQQQQQKQQQQLQQQQQSSRSDEISPPKRKLTEEDEDHDDQPRDKRLRTTILPEQLDYLYQKYQIDCNPSRKQLETIAADVGLKKRVVQVWFQNTRARERKGQYRAHQQLIHKRCPFCRALFRAKSALESHLATKHPDELAKGDINVDNIPDAASEAPSSSQSSPNVGLDMAKLMANPFNIPPYMPMLPTTPDPLQNHMKKMYEDSLKRYLTEMTPTRPAHSGTPPAQRSTPKTPKTVEQEMPLDLSKSSVKQENEDLDRSFDLNASHISWDDSRSENEFDESLANPSSPSMQRRAAAGKRYRTQMSSLQIRLMKSLFVDYKTPTMAECEMLGREISLPKRVIQVWFQNARAKEKKARAGATTPKSDNDHPEKCQLCEFQYTHKYAIQDHIFTKAHIDHLKRFLKTELEKEQEQSGLKVEGKCETLPDVSQHPHLAQLQAMGLQAMGIPAPNPAHSPASSILTDSRNKTSGSTHTSTSKDSKKPSGKKESMEGLPQMMMPFGPAVFPGQENGAFLPFMYPGTPFYPGLTGSLAGMPFMQPGFYPPAADPMFSFDASSYGTPLSLLQIPQSAIRNVTAKLGDQNATSATYTQDCRKFAELNSLVSASDAASTQEVKVDVGYICKKCHMVYPAKEACVAHQRMLCYVNKSQSNNAILKLEQIQYECKVCKDRFSALSDVKQHCEGESHKTKVLTIGLPSYSALKSDSTLQSEKVH